MVLYGYCEKQYYLLICLYHINHKLCSYGHYITAILIVQQPIYRIFKIAIFIGFFRITTHNSDVNPGIF